MTNQPPLSYVPMAPGLLGIATGIITYKYIDNLWLSIGAVVVAAIVATCLTMARRRWTARIFAFFAIGILTAWIHCRTESDDIGHDSSAIVKAVIEDIEPTSSGARAKISTDDGITALIYVRGHRRFNIGDSVACKMPLKAPAACRWPGQFDYNNYLRQRGIVATARIDADSLKATGKSNALRFKMKRLQQSMADCLRRSNLSDGSTRFLIAALLGDSSALTPDDRSRFSSAGIAHLLALSGTHVAVVTIIIGVLLFPLYMTGHRQILLLTTVALLWAYTILTGMSPSVVRAVTMTTIVSGAYLTCRPYSAFNSLLVAAVAILLFDPSALTSIGFQLSFIAVAAILITFRLPALHLSGAKRWWRTLLSGVAVTIAATMATAPLTVGYFGIFPVYFLLANLPAMVIITPLLAGGMAVIALEWLGMPADWMCRPVDMLYGWLDSIVAWISTLPFHLIDDISLPWPAMVAWIGLLIALIALLWRPKLPASYITVLTTAIIFVLTIITSKDKPIYPAEEMFMVNNSRYTGLLYRHGNKAWLLTPEPHTIALTILTQASRTHRNYLSQREIKSLSLAPDTMSEGNLQCQGSRLRFGKETMMFISADTASIGDDIATAIVCRGVTGTVFKKLSGHNIDSIVIAPSTHWHVRKTLVDSLPQKNVVDISSTILFRHFP